MYKIIDKINENDEYDEEESRIDNKANSVDARELESNSSAQLPKEKETLSFNDLILNDDFNNSEKV
jgi:hypothetical protein